MRNPRTRDPRTKDPTSPSKNSSSSETKPRHYLASGGVWYFRLPARWCRLLVRIAPSSSTRHFSCRSPVPPGTQLPPNGCRTSVIWASRLAPAICRRITHKRGDFANHSWIIVKLAVRKRGEKCSRFPIGAVNVEYGPFARGVASAATSNDTLANAMLAQREEAQVLATGCKPQAAQ